MAKIDIPQNSLSGKVAEQKTEKKFEKVTTGKVVAKEKNDIQKIADAFIAEDLKTVWGHVLSDVLIPGVKTVLADIVWKSINMALFGEDRPRPTTGTNYANPSRVSYNGYSANRNNQPRNMAPVQRSYQDILFASRGDADEVLHQMAGALADYGQVSVGDLCDLAGITANYTDNKYGWYDLRGAYVRAVAGGYVIDLPRPVAFTN